MIRLRCSCYEEALEYADGLSDGDGYTDWTIEPCYDGRVILKIWE